VGRRGWRWRRAVGSAAAVVLVASVAPAAVHPPAHARDVANYTITAAYDADRHSLTAHEVLTWYNPTRQTATHLYFHLYLNAFANSDSSFMRELGPRWREWLRRHPDGWGYIEITSLHVGSSDLSSRLAFVHPDDDNIDDRTVVRLALDAPVPPHGTVDVEIDFVARLPKIVARAGYAGPFAMVAQWFPKIGVFQEGAWNCHQYHLNSEFFADFGAYDVTLTVPGAAVVGATGLLQSEHDNADGTRTVRYGANDVHDFAWTIDPRFRVFTQDVDGITVRLLLQPNHVDQVTRHLNAARVAIQTYREWIGAYPYPQLTIVDPGPGARRAGGMEYPTLITVGTAWWMPDWLRLPEVVTVHEFGHQYWYGMVASNEFEEAWLDEGVNSYFEGRIMDAAFGAASYADILGLHVSSVPVQRLRYLQAATHDPMVRPAWGFLDSSSYAAISYAKTALALDTLGGYLGEATLRAGLRAYFERWRFHHPRGEDLLEALNQASGQDLGWYFDEVVRGTDILDYAVTRVTAEPLEGFAGYRFTDGRPGEATPPETPAEQWYRSEVVVERLGGVVMPVTLQVVFDDGTNASESWDGRDRWKRFEYRGNQRVEWAVVDPGDTMPLDYDRLNNSRMRDAGTRGMVRIVTRLAFWFQNLLVLLSGL
jgi:hypothetical protein